MVTKKYSLSVSGKDDAECLQKMQAISALIAKLSGKEFQNMAYIVNHDPATMNLVRPILNR